jgi:hypothetical protein
MNAMLKRLLLIYGTPDAPNPDAWFAEAAKLLGGYTSTEMDAAVEIILKTRRQRSWPTIGDCVAACQEAREEAAPKWTPIPERFPEWSKERIEKADRLIVSALGQKAADEGWILGLHDFCRNKERLPRQDEVPKIKASSHEFDEYYGIVARGDGGVLSAPLRRLGDSLLERRNKYARMAWGEIV